jgi:hypothetical protein
MLDVSKLQVKEMKTGFYALLITHAPQVGEKLLLKLQMLNHSLAQPMQTSKLKEKN